MPFNIDEIAALLDVSAPTVKRHWGVARVWLFKQINANDLLSAEAQESVDER